jgi:hypothetical protein
MSEVTEKAIKSEVAGHVRCMKLVLKKTAPLVLPLTLWACSDAGSEDTTSGGDGDSAQTGDGDAVTGDGDAVSGDGDAVTGDGDMTTGDGDGDASTGPTGQVEDPGEGYTPTGLSDPDQTYAPYTPGDNDRVISRAKYFEQLQGFWLAQNIANWTGLITEFDKDGQPATMPFYTDDDWGGADLPNIWGGSGLSPTIDWLVTESPTAWGADDDTDIEYIYFHLLSTHKTSLLTGEQIRDGWIEHIYDEREATPYGADGGVNQNYLWVSNQTAHLLMIDDGMTPPATSEPENNSDYMMIDAQLTTESFGLYSPARPDFALEMAHLPIRTTAKEDAEWISEFYVIMHSLASYVNPELPMKDKVFWLAEQARQRLPAGSYSAAMYDYIKGEYEANADKDDWESTRDAVYQRYQVASNDGYVFQEGFDGGINFAASLVSLFYGEGDLKRTMQIGVLSGWDSDNPTATWGGLLGFMMGKEAVKAAFATESTNLSDYYWIHRTRRNFPDHNGDDPGEDSLPLMAERMLYIVDRAVMADLGGGVDLEKDLWFIPDNGGALE